MINKIKSLPKNGLAKTATTASTANESPADGIIGRKPSIYAGTTVFSGFFGVVDSGKAL
jgi:hypothetical protein